MVYGGTIKPGHTAGKQVIDIVSAFQSYGQYIAKSISDDERQDIVNNACPGAGASVAVCIPRTPWPVAIEAMGMSLPYSSSTPAVTPEKMEECFRVGNAVRHLLEIDLRPGIS